MPGVIGSIGKIGGGQSGGDATPIPSEKDRHHLGLGFVDELSEAKKGLAEAIIIAVSEDQFAMLADRRRMGIEPSARGVKAGRRTLLVTSLVAGLPAASLAIGPCR